MSSFKRSHVFDPLDLEIMDRVYEAAWALVAQEPLRDTKRDVERQEKLRKLVFASAGTGHVDFDNLCDRVMASIPKQLIPRPEPTDKVEVGAPGESEAGARAI